MRKIHFMVHELINVAYNITKFNKIIVTRKLNYLISIQIFHICLFNGKLRKKNQCK